MFCHWVVGGGVSRKMWDRVFAGSCLAIFKKMIFGESFAASIYPVLLNFHMNLIICTLTSSCNHIFGLITVVSREVSV